MALESILAVITELIAAAIREGVSALATTAATPDVGTVFRFAPIIALPFAVARSFWRGAFWLGVALMGMEVYFIFNRLTVFANKPLSWGELLGNAAELLLALILIVRKERWKGAGRSHVRVDSPSA